MPKQNLDIISIRDFVNGMIHENIVDDFKQPDNSCSESINLHFDIMGAVKLRKGLTLLGNQISAGTDILGLYQFLDEGTGTDDQIIAVNGTVVYYLSGSTWTSIRTGLTSGKKARFTNFADRVIMVNGTDTTQGWDGDTGGSFDTTNLSGAPTGYYVDNFRSRVWIANTDSNPSRIEYSSVISAVGGLTWNSSEQFIDISPGDGEDIIGIKRSPKALLVFKSRHIYRIFSVNETDPDPQINVGTHCNESIVEGKDGIYFYDWVNSAIYRYAGATPVEISRPIKPFLEGVSLANRDSTGGWRDNDHIYHSLGDITVNDVTFSNAVSRYTISTRTWTIYSYPQQILFGTLYDDGSNLMPVIGDNDGNILRFNNGNTDNGTPITFSLITKWYDLSGIRASTDSITRLSALHRNGQGVNLQYQIDFPERESSWKTIGELQKAPVDVFNTNISGHRIRFRLTGTSTGEPFIFQGLEILKAFTNFIVE